MALMFNWLYKNTNSYKNHFSDTRKVSLMLRQPDKSIEVVVLGSNAPKYAFDFSEISSLNCVNLAIGPEAFQYDFIILKKVIKKLKKGAFVILPVCPGKIFLDRYKSVSNYTKYYNILNKYEMPDYSFRSRLIDYEYPLLFHPRKFVRLIKDIRPEDNLNIVVNKMTDEEVVDDASWWINECWNPEFGIEIENMKPLSQEIRKAVDFNIDIVANIAKYCEDHNLNLIMPILPLSTPLASKFSEEYVKTYMINPIKIATCDFDVKIPNYLRDTRFNGNEHYINSFFMNRMGAKKFTEVFVKENITC